MTSMIKNKHNYNDNNPLANIQNQSLVAMNWANIFDTSCCGTP